MEAGSKAVYVVFVIILMAGVAAIGLTGFLFENGENEYEKSHDYTVVSGTYEGASVSGEGHSRYYNESSREYLYSFETVIKYGGSERTVSFEVICSSDKVPVSKIYDEKETETIDGTECVWWSYDSAGEKYDFAIDGKMVVHRYAVSGAGWSFAAVLDDKE